MKLMELIEKRHSVRRFSDRPILEDQLENILKAVNLAPTAGGIEDLKLTVIKDRALRAELQEATFIDGAPIVLVFSALPKASKKFYGERGEKLYSIQDATIACTYAMLAVESLGLATSWVGNFNEEEIKRIIGAEEDEIPVAILPIGYAAPDSKTTLKSVKEKEVKYI